MAYQDSLQSITIASILTCQTLKMQQYPSKATQSFLNRGLPELCYDDFEYVSHPGDGAWGSVFRYRRISDGKFVAMKFFGMRGLETNSIPLPFLIESEILHEWDLTEAAGATNKSSIPKVLGYLVDTYDGYASGHIRINPRVNPYAPHHLSGKRHKGRYLVKVTECCDKDIMDVLMAGRTFNQREVAQIFKGIVLAVRGLHSNGIIHRDLKLENFVFEDDSYRLPQEVVDDILVKVIDLGNATLLANNIEIPCTAPQLNGTPIYRAPETTGRNVHSKATDIWQIGVCLWILSFRAMPNGLSFRGTEPKFPTEIEISDSLKSLLRRIFDHNPTTRITIDEILSHTWVTENTVAITEEHVETVLPGTESTGSEMDEEISFGQYGYTAPINPEIPQDSSFLFDQQEEQSRALTVYQQSRYVAPQTSYIVRIPQTRLVTCLIRTISSFPKSVIGCNDLVPSSSARISNTIDISKLLRYVVDSYGRLSKRKSSKKSLYNKTGVIATDTLGFDKKVHPKTRSSLLFNNLNTKRLSNRRRSKSVDASKRQIARKTGEKSFPCTAGLLLPFDYTSTSHTLSADEEQPYYLSRAGCGRGGIKNMFS